ncbi:MAG: hypothetical protein IJP33_00260, partial [Firmicutes bacterium]|nr:hypothetical protein [Bacillota bacterium]
MGSSLFTSLSFTRISFVSLLAGLIIGMLAQRSRMCFIGGWRDFFLVRDTYLLRGFIIFFITSLCLFLIFYHAGFYLNNYPWFNRPPVVMTIDVPWSGDGGVDHFVRHYNYCDLTYVTEMVT